MESDVAGKAQELQEMIEMKFRGRIFQLGCCVLVACFAGSTAASADCADLLNQFNAAITARSLPDTKAVERKIAVDPACGNRAVEVSRQRSVLELIVARQLRDKNAPLSDYEGLLTEASELQWAAAQLLGDIRFKDRKFSDATAAYERALETIKNVGLTPTPPDPKVIKAIFDRAVESRMLAANEEGTGRATFVVAAKDHRDGSMGGAMSDDVRGVKFDSVPLPIGFETRTANFTPLGQQAANELLKALAEQNPAQLTLVGHTDERGEADYNMRLSDQRVKAVAAFLKQNGITAKIVTVAKGKSEPLQLADTSGLSREDIWALNRRVVWQRN
jgi:OOP family OmpA-OmpF porin